MPSHFLPPPLTGSPTGYSTSPRWAMINTVAKDTFGSMSKAAPSTKRSSNIAQPLLIIISAMSTFAPELQEPETFFQQFVPYFQKASYAAGTTLWSIGDEASSFYIVESGALKATTEMPDLSQAITEIMLPAR